MAHMIRRLLVAITLTLATSCTTTQTQPAPTTTPATPTTTTATAQPTAPTLDLTAEQQARIAQALQWGEITRDRMTVTVNDRIAAHTAREEHLAQCLRDQGFDFVAINQGFAEAILEDPDIPRDHPDFPATYGLGITTLTYPADMTQPEATGHQHHWTPAPPEPDQNPNAATYNTLSDADRAAYDTTYETCSAEADNATPPNNDTLREALTAQLADLEQRIKADPAYAALTARTNACIDTPGYTFDGLDQLERWLNTQLADLNEDHEPGGTDWREHLAELQQTELDVVAAFNACIGTTGWHAELDQIAAPHRAQFITTNQAALAGLLTETE